MRRHLLPVLTLFLLAPVIGELVSGSSPPANWLQPGNYLFMVPLYGAGALLVRELAVRWKTGWAGVILLGAAYGILEEGIDVMSFFNTAWPDLGASALYGRWADVSWIWTVHLTCSADSNRLPARSNTGRCSLSSRNRGRRRRVFFRSLLSSTSRLALRGNARPKSLSSRALGETNADTRPQAQAARS